MAGFYTATRSGPMPPPRGRLFHRRLHLLWVRTFETIEELRQALLTFRETYNTTWLIERHGFLSPAEYRRRQLQPLAQAA